ncbi:hypothetical protein A2707_04530 [Candidatus Saccharibacteria bacterium RIFCSPHIGHO2_01_FULL_45_15]|nr:MAG: hypothetical protein A2707_04530 [Candidatus Saccharibacteria bacterium RIFCSPHIGHO2_01_FULL_45_15]OGL27198.1 MAG: hypothetical protein A3C39_01415 [Candidatus Saccharibacteria bacterium RIFCSPHIGHO2_02_FULL_46_12]OGL32759.1 MAG: hypothetical protein A3E76_05430 [Candidatus Saccharibacteria bacterium RIFCSPHIGHO2_12_FULL_44_22]
MMVKKKQQKKNKFKSLWVIIPAAIALSVIGFATAFLIVDAVTDNNDKQKFLTLDREMYPVYEKIKAVDPSMPWQYDKGCVPTNFIPSGSDYCFVRIATEIDVDNRQAYIDIFKKYEAAFNASGVLSQTDSSDWTIARYSPTQLQVGGFWTTYHQKTDKIRCDYTSSVQSKDARYEKKGDIIGTLPARGVLEMDCSSPAHGFWFPSSNKSYSTFD